MINEILKKVRRIALLTTLAVGGMSANGQTVSFDGCYAGDIVTNFSGGIKSGTTYMGYLMLGATLDTERANLWKGGTFRLSVANTHGGMATDRLVGDMGGVSNIEAGNHSFFQELWYGQKFGKFGLKAGLMDFNSNYATTASTESYVNSSFGLHTPLSSNFTSPTFPLTGLGIDLRYNINDKFAIQTAIYDGQLTDFDKNPYNLKWSVTPSGGYLSITEIQYTPVIKQRLTGQYSIGGYYYTHNSSFGFYTSASQTLWASGERKLSAFVQGAYSQKCQCENSGFVGAGLNIKGLFSGRENDWAGIALASAFINDACNETALELSYILQLGSGFFLQPDLQYVLHPSGSRDTQNAFVGILRGGVEF